MNASEERQVRAGLQRLVDSAPDIGPTPSDLFERNDGKQANWRLLVAVAACAATVVGLVGLVAVRDADSRPADDAEPSASPAPTASTSTVPVTSPATSIVVIDLSDPPPVATFDQPDDFTRLFGLVLQAKVDECMTAAGFEYRRSPAPDSPSAILDEWQNWVDGQEEQEGWSTQKAQCVDGFVMSNWYGDVNALNYIGQASYQWGGNIAAIYRRPDMIEATRAVVDCAKAAGIAITADPNTNAQDAFEEVWTAFSQQIGTALEAIPENDLSGIEQMDQFGVARAAAIDSVCPSFSASERVFKTAQREDQTAWLIAHPDVAQRVADEWADDIVRLQQILDALPD